MNVVQLWQLQCADQGHGRMTALRRPAHPMGEFMFRLSRVLTKVSTKIKNKVKFETLFKTKINSFSKYSFSQKLN